MIKININARHVIIGLCLVIFGYCLGGLTVYKQWFPFEQIKSLKYKLQIESFELQAAAVPRQRNTLFQIFSPPVDVVMIGDSLTEAGAWSEIFQEIKVANRGIAGDTTHDILRRMEPIFAVNAKKAFVMIGINDIFYGEPIDAIFANYSKIVHQLKAKNIQVYIQSTIECTNAGGGVKLAKVRALNAKLNAFALEQNIPFIDINKVLASEEKGLLLENTYDGIHLKGIGYLKWSQVIKPYVFSK